uniref:SH2 domain-containing protein n=1 Tax=Photinus pyralis TaxID=7054 RepID=A0A1Y1MGG8_PHOPY
MITSTIVSHFRDNVMFSTCVSVPSTYRYIKFNVLEPFAQHPRITSGKLDEEKIAELKSEIWFHGQISRADAERLLQKDGDFLVRESPASEGQYVLSGMQENMKKHLLLIDPEGVVRTKDRMFQSVSHLINYHCENSLPIISAESALVLRTPIPRTS